MWPPERQAKEWSKYEPQFSLFHVLLDLVLGKMKTTDLNEVSVCILGSLLFYYQVYTEIWPVHVLSFKLDQKILRGETVSTLLCTSSIT